ncbi:hypothetical protein ABFA07_001691 [Porites harrisoni]
MNFAKAYKEEITLAYYCFNVVITTVIFLFGTIYLRRRDRRDQQRRDWRQFAETFRGQYSTLEYKQVLSCVSNTNETFENVLICPEITGLDVLRYMLNNSYFMSRSSRKSALYKLKKDLNSIFQLLNTCASFILLEPVPISNMRAELGELVTELGQVTLPFFTGDQRQTVLKCLKHFSRDGEIETEKELRDIDLTTIKEMVPYIEYLSFDNQVGRHQRSTHYSKINKFQFEFDPGFDQDHPLSFLKVIQEDLQDEKYLSDFARESQELLSNTRYIDQVDSDNERLVVMKVLHQVRMDIHSLLKKEGIDEAFFSNSVVSLREVYKRVTTLKPDKEILKATCEQFIDDLTLLKDSSHSYHMSRSFLEQLENMRKTYFQMIVIRDNAISSQPQTSTTV